MPFWLANRPLRPLSPRNSPRPKGRPKSRAEIRSLGLPLGPPSSLPAQYWCSLWSPKLSSVAPTRQSRSLPPDCRAFGRLARASLGGRGARVRSATGRACTIRPQAVDRSGHAPPRVRRATDHASCGPQNGVSGRNGARLMVLGGDGELAKCGAHSAQVFGGPQSWASELAGERGPKLWVRFLCLCSLPVDCGRQVFCELLSFPQVPLVTSPFQCRASVFDAPEPHRQTNRQTDRQRVGLLQCASSASAPPV